MGVFAQKTIIGAKMIRISGVILPPNKHIRIALRSVFGIGATRANKICDRVGIDSSAKVSTLTDAQGTDIQKAVNDYNVEGDLRRERELNIKRLMDIKCRRGIRHRRGLPVRGQRTKTNARTRKGKGRGKSGKK